MKHLRIRGGVGVGWAHPSLTVQNVLNFMQFWGNFEKKLYVGIPSFRVGTSSYENHGSAPVKKYAVGAKDNYESRSGTRHGSLTQNPSLPKPYSNFHFDRRRDYFISLRIYEYMLLSMIFRSRPLGAYEKALRSDCLEYHSDKTN